MQDILTSATAPHMCWSEDACLRVARPMPHADASFCRERNPDLPASPGLMYLQTITLLWLMCRCLILGALAQVHV